MHLSQLKLFVHLTIENDPLIYSFKLNMFLKLNDFMFFDKP